jgi:hypothetical protein
MPSDGKSSHCLSQVELKNGTFNQQKKKCIDMGTK